MQKKIHLSRTKLAKDILKCANRFSKTVLIET